MTKTEITAEMIQELLPKSTSLYYVDYRESLDEQPKLLQEAIHNQSLDVLYENIDDWFREASIEATIYYEKELADNLVRKYEITEEEAKEIIHENDWIQDVLYDRDDSTPVKDLLRNTGEQTMFFDTGYEVEGESWSWDEKKVKKVRNEIKRHLGLRFAKDNVYDGRIDMMIRQASYGGQLVIYFYENVEDMLAPQDTKSIYFTDFHVAIINTGNGSGDSCELDGCKTKLLPFDATNIYIDKTIGYNYTFEVCGMSSNWCDDTNVCFSTKKSGAEVKESRLKAIQERDKAYQMIYDGGKCSFGDTKYGRHRNVTYINDSPCGNKCQDCGQFWVD